MTTAAGNRCGHRPNQPSLTPACPIRKGQGGLPRILSLAAERAKIWYRHPQKCHVLNKGNRQTRSERREAYQVIVETMLSVLDLASLCLGTPTLDNGFVDVDMKAMKKSIWHLDAVQPLHYCFPMPEIIRFARSVLRMYADDHGPPHFHIVGSDFAVMMDIRSLEIISGKARSGDIAEALAWAKDNLRTLEKLWHELNERDQP
jgi:hypothetical protein